MWGREVVVWDMRHQTETQKGGREQVWRNDRRKGKAVRFICRLELPSRRDWERWRTGAIRSWKERSGGSTGREVCWQWLLETEKRLEFNGSLSVQRRAVVWKIIPWRMEIGNCGIKHLMVSWQRAGSDSGGSDLLFWFWSASQTRAN